MEKKNSYWKDVVFQTSGNTVAQAIGILGMPILTRVYTPEAFALQASFLQIVMFLTAFISFRMEYFIPLVSTQAESNLLGKWVFLIGFYMTLLSTIAIHLLHTVGVFQYFNVSLNNIFYLAPLTAYVICISLLFQHEAQRQGAFKKTAMAEVVAKSSYVSIGALWSIFTVSSGLVLSTMFGAMGKIFSLRRYIVEFLSGIKSCNTKENVISIYKGRSKGMVLSNTILTISGLMPILFVGRCYGVDVLGQFSLVMATIFLPSGLIGAAVGNVFYQRAAIFWDNRNFCGLKDLWKDTVFKLFIVGVPIYLFIYLVSPWAYVVFFGDQWIQAGKIAEVMSLAAFFSFLAGPLDRMSLVLGVGYYLPLIHFLRLLVTFLIILGSYLHSFSIADFILFFSIGMCFLYIIDIFFCRFLLFDWRAYG